MRLPLLLQSGALHHLSLHILEESVGGSVRGPFTNIVKIKILFHRSTYLVYIPLFFLLHSGNSLSAYPPYYPAPAQSLHTQVHRNNVS